MTTKPSLDSLAPYPKTLEDATAEAMAKDHAVRTQLHFVRSMDLPFGHPDERHAINAMSWSFGITYLLRALIEHAPDQADEIASGLWSEWQGGDGFGEWSFEWLTEYGIDTGKVNEIAKGLAEMQAGPEMVSVRKDEAERQATERDQIKATLDEVRGFARTLMAGPEGSAAPMVGARLLDLLPPEFSQAALPTNTEGL